MEVNPACGTCYGSPGKLTVAVCFELKTAGFEVFFPLSYTLVTLGMFLKLRFPSVEWREHPPHWDAGTKGAERRCLQGARRELRLVSAEDGETGGGRRRGAVRVGAGLSLLSPLLLSSPFSKGRSLLFPCAQHCLAFPCLPQGTPCLFNLGHVFAPHSPQRWAPPHLPGSPLKPRGSRGDPSSARCLP